MEEIIDYLTEAVYSMQKPEQEKMDVLGKIYRFITDYSCHTTHLLPEEILDGMRLFYESGKSYQEIKEENRTHLKPLCLESKLETVNQVFYILLNSKLNDEKDIKDFFGYLKGVSEKKQNKKVFSLMFLLDKPSTPIISSLIAVKEKRHVSYDFIYTIIEFYEWLAKESRIWIYYLFLYEVEKKEKHVGMIIDRTYHQFTQEFVEYYDQEAIKFKKEQRNYYRFQNYLKDFIQKIKNMDPFIFLTVPADTFTKLPENILVPFLKKVNAHNEEVVKRVERENKILNEFDLNRLLEQVGMKNSFNEIETEYIIANTNIDDLEKNVKQLAFCFADTFLSNKDLMEILIESDTNKIHVIKNALMNNRITKEFLRTHLNLFVLPTFQIFEENMNLLQNKGIKLFELNQVFLQPNLEKYLSLAACYELPLEEKSVLTNMSKPYFFDALDFFIESNLYDVILNTPNIFDKDLIAIAKRIFIAKKLQLTIFDEEGKLKKSITDGVNFCIPDQLLSDYIFNIVPFVVEENAYHTLENSPRLEVGDCSSFEEQKEGTLIYNFDGVLVSRMKFLRNQAVLLNEENLLDSLLYGTIFNQEEYEKIKNLCTNLKLERKK